MIARARRLGWYAGAPLRLVLIGLIKLYRITLSGVVGGQCRFSPTCSAYGEEAIRVHGAVKGVAMAAWRVARCSPLTKGGYEPVPPRRTYDSVIQRRPVAS